MTKSIFTLVMLIGMIFGGLLVLDHLKNKEIQERATAQKQREDEKQIQCLATNIYWEARGESIEGQVAVAQVTLNRSQHSDFPDSICKVVYQKTKSTCQFSWVCEDNYKTTPMQLVNYRVAESVARDVVAGRRIEKLKEALYFHAVYVNPGWKRKKLATFGRHKFYGA